MDLDRTYQLVIQFSLSENDSALFNAILQIEDELEDWLGPDVIVDGNDFGQGEMNIFIHTDTPRETFERVQVLIDTKRDFNGSYRAGYRSFTEEKFVSLWPKGSTEFNVA